MSDPKKEVKNDPEAEGIWVSECLEKKVVGCLRDADEQYQKIRNERWSDHKIYIPIEEYEYLQFCLKFKALVQEYYCLT